MKRGLQQQAERIGLSPGSRDYTGVTSVLPGELELTVYDEQSVEVANTFEARVLDANKVNWVNFIGVHDTVLFEDLAKQLELHSLTLEDIRVTGQRPKLEVFDDYLFVLLHSCDFIDGRIRIEQISLLLKGNTVVSVQEFSGNTLSGVANRISKKRGRIRKESSEYLLYCLIDAIVDQYFVVLEKLQDEIDKLEEDILKHKTQGLLENSNNLRQDILWLRQSLKPLHLVLDDLMTDENSKLAADYRPFLQDSYDHLSQCLDNLEVMRDMLGDLFELYSSYSSLRLNEIMKFLTMMSSIFIPLSFITGIFGMNFERMPGLSLAIGFFMVVTTMIFIAAVMLYYFWRKKWL